MLPKPKSDKKSYHFSKNSSAPDIDRAGNKIRRSTSDGYMPKKTLMGNDLGKKGLSKERKYNVDAYNKGKK
jgi:hypothetical protein